MPRQYKTVAWIVILTFSLSIIPGIGSLGPKTSHAFDAPPKDQGHTGPNSENPDAATPPKDPKQAKGGDPVDVASGNFTHSQKDILIPGRIPLEVTRTFNCQDRLEGPFGYGWTYTYYYTLVDLTAEGGSTTEPHVIIRRPDGKRQSFTRNADGTFTAPKGTYVTLIQSGSTYTLTEKNGARCVFAGGALASIIDRNDNRITLNYDGSGKLSSVTDSAGRSLTFTYGTNNKIATVTDPAGNVFSYGYDGNNNLTIASDPAGNTLRYTYDSYHRLTGITDPKGVTYLTNTYDSSDRVTQQYDSGGNYTYTYNPDSKYTTVRDRRGYNTTYYYNDTGNPTTIRDANSRDTIRTWDTNFNLTSYRDARGFTTQYTSDAKGNILTITDPQGRVTSFTYEAVYNQVTSITDALGRTSRLEYDARGNLTKTIDALGKETTYAYNTQGDLLSVTNAQGGFASFGYDAYGHVTKITDAAGGTTNFTVDILGNVTSVTDQNGHITRNEFSNLNQLIKVTDALNNITRFTYDQNGNRASIIDPQENTTNFVYDNFNRLLTVMDALGNQKRFTYDANDNVITTTDANGNATTFAYDALNRLTKVTNPLGQATEKQYDPNGNLTSIKDAKGNITSYTYDNLNRLTQVTYPDGSTEKQTYDAVGNLVSKINRRGETISYAYDGMNRLLTKTYPDLTKVINVFDSLGRLTSTSNAFSTISYAYDALGRVTQCVQDGKKVQYQYDRVGNRTKLVYPDGTAVNYAYDALNRLKEIKKATGEILASYSYDTLSRRTQASFLNGTTATYAYDQIGRLSSLINKVISSGAIFSSFGYTFDRVGNRTSMATPAGTHSYIYDKIYQLTQVSYPGGYPFNGTSYNYDALGNRVTTVELETTGYATNNLNQYTEVRGVPHSYDGNGNLTGDGTNTYLYDFENRLIQATTPAVTVSFAYDPLGRRISKSTDSGTVRYHYDGNQVIGEEDADGVLVRKFVYGPGIDEPLAMEIVATADTYQYHLNGLGSVSEITDSAGAVVERYEYDVYGRSVVRDATGTPLDGSNIGNPFTFTGREYDLETGLFHYRARYYSPALGRFLQTDPVGYLDSMNLYAYVTNNPVNFVDPLGLSKWNWGAFGKGILKALVYAAVGIAAAVVIVAVLPAAVVGSTAFAVGVGIVGGIGALSLGVGTGEVIMGQTVWGRELSAEERSERAGELLVGWTTLAVAAGMRQAKAPPTTQDYPEGSFSMHDWSGYPEGLPKPQGPFRIVEGAEYDAARNAANAANRAIHQANPSLTGMQIHEVQPVKFGGSPVDIQNKMPLTPLEHAKVTVWWNQFLKSVK